jgi:cystathionine gamma-synthase
MGGAVAGPSHLTSLMREARDVMGAVLDPHAAFLIARGMKTLALRVRQQNQNAQAIAEALEKHPAVSKVYYPGLASHPSHAIAKAQMHGFGGVISFVVKGGKAAAARVVDSAQIPLIAPSLGGVESLIEQPAIMSYFEMSEEQLKTLDIEPALIRLAVGVEDTDELVRDLLLALERA